jgi:general L-amino acid transport system substrate-binding protein
VGSYFRTNNLALKKVFIASADDITGAFKAGRCDAYTADVSELGAMRSRMPTPDDFEILADQISKEPLAQLVRNDDVPFFDILRWTVFAIINAEELGINSRNVDDMLKSSNPDIQRLLGVAPGNGKSLGLDEKWAYNIIKRLGNYGEIFERNVGNRSPIKLARGLNRLWTDGGLIYAPPLR